MLTTQMHSIAAAERLDEVRYAIRDLAVIAEEVAKQGHKILYLNIGDPLKFDFPTPPHMIEAVHKAMRDGRNGYTPSMGVPEAVEAIEAEARRKGINNIRSIFVTQGASEAVELCLSALVNPGDNLLTPSPEYPLYSAVLAKVSARLNGYDLDEDNGWQPDFEDIESKIDARTKGIVVINPNNPTGVLYSRVTLERIAEIARRHNLVVFSDEIYDKLLLDKGLEHLSFGAVAPDVPTITFNGLSKSYVVPGWRVGWGIASGDAAVIGPYLEGVHKLLRARICANVTQYAIKPALQGPQEHREQIIDKLRRRRDMTMKWTAATPRVSCVAPEAAFYAYPKLDIPDDDLGFVKDLLAEKHVLLVHGSGFGQKKGTKHVRIVYLPDEPTLTRAYEAMTDFMAKRYN
jgi:alanine-synthesizing transaminase